jgi:hypothetical protein
MNLPGFVDPDASTVCMDDKEWRWYEKLKIVPLAFGFYCDLFFISSFPSSIWNDVNQCQSLHCVLELDLLSKLQNESQIAVVSLTFN